MNKYHLGAVIAIVIAICSFKNNLSFCFINTMISGFLLVCAEYHNYKLNHKEDKL